MVGWVKGFPWPFGGSSLLIGLRGRSMQYWLQAGPSRCPPPSTSLEGSKASSPGASELFIAALPLGVTFVCLSASASSWWGLWEHARCPTRHLHPVFSHSLVPDGCRTYACWMNNWVLHWLQSRDFPACLCSPTQYRPHHIREKPRKSSQCNETSHDQILYLFKVKKLRNWMHFPAERGTSGGPVPLGKSWILDQIKCACWKDGASALCWVLWSPDLCPQVPPLPQAGDLHSWRPPLPGPALGWILTYFKFHRRCEMNLMTQTFLLWGEGSGTGPRLFFPLLIFRRHHAPETEGCREDQWVSAFQPGVEMVTFVTVVTPAV